MPYAVGYARFSSIKQGKGTSLARQQELIAEWISNNKEYQIYPKTFQDLGRSASKGDHLKHGFGKLLQAIEQKEIGEGDVILVEAIDRIGRLHELQMFSLINDIITSKVKIITLEDGVTYGPEIKTDQIWTLLGKVQQAFLYSQSLSQRIIKSYRVREDIARNGIIPRRRTPIWLTSDGKLKDGIATAMKGAFEDALAGLGERRILRNLKGKHSAFERINPSTIRRWLTNKTAIGYWKEHKIYPAVVSEELFYQVQQRFEDEYKPATAPRTYFLSGLIKCGECGANMQIKVNKHSPFSMHCSTRCKFGDARCPNGKSFPVPVLMHICQDTATSAVETAMQRTQLTIQRKEIIVIDGKLREATKIIENLTHLQALHGVVPELNKQLTTAIENRRTLDNQKLLLNIELEENHCRYEEAWDYQYELIEDNPMRLNALLQSANYNLTCFNDGRIIANTTGNEFSSSRYAGYDRKRQAYKVLVGDTMKYIFNQQGTIALGRAATLRKMLEGQRPAQLEQQEDQHNSECEIIDFYKPIPM